MSMTKKDLSQHWSESLNWGIRMPLDGYKLGFPIECSSANFGLRRCCLCPPYRPVGKEDEHWKKSRCVWEAVFPPWCWVEPVIALDNVCAKLNFVYILSVFTRISSLILRTFSVLLSTIMVILILERSSAEPQSIDHYKSTAWALQKPLTCQGMWSWVYVCVGVCACAQSQTARVRAVQLQ